MEKFDCLHPRPPSRSTPPPLGPSPVTSAAESLIPKVKDVRLVETDKEAKILIGFNESGPIHAQAPPAPPVRVRATTTRLPTHGPSLLELRGADTQADLPHLLASLNAEQRARIHDKYGRLPIETALGIASDELSSAYKSIDILGFSILPMHLPVTLLVVDLVVVLLIWWTLVHANKRGLSQTEELEDALYPLIQNRVMRPVLWAVVPVAGVWIAAAFDLAAIGRGGWMAYFIVLGSLLLVGLGGHSVVTGRALFAQTKKSAPES